MKRLDVMVDIETLGVGDDADIIQIAYAGFDITTGEVKFTKNTYIDSTSKNGDIDTSTLLWWLETNPTLLQLIINKGTESKISLYDCLLEFVTSVNGYKSDEFDVYLWGNGILFDNKLIKTKCLSYGFEYPIHFRNDRDLRTLFELTQIKTGLSVDEIKDTVRNLYKTNTTHDALDDVMNQINIANWCYNAIMK